MKENLQKAETEIALLKEKLKSFEKNNKNDSIREKTLKLEEEINKLRSEKQKNTEELKDIEAKLKSIGDDQKEFSDGLKKSLFLRNVDPKNIDGIQSPCEHGG